MTYISALNLTAFRNYQAASIENLGNHFVVLIGENGAGKTNCLEAISALSPGRGLRGASVAECQSQATNTMWAVSAVINDNDGNETRLGVGRNAQKPDKKLVRANGSPVKTQSELGDILRTIWLTPQMDGLFLQASSERRRFFDRLVAAFDGGHVGRMTRYEKSMRQRLNLLKIAQETGQAADDFWIPSLEKIMAETSVAIAAARLDTLNKIQNVIGDKIFDEFPAITLSLNGDIENNLITQSAVNVEDMVAERLKSFRNSDGQTGRTNYGVGRTDMNVVYNDKNIDAGQCSTGEQKAFLTTIILGHARMVAARYGVPPLLLFDEIGAHFDPKRRDTLFEILNDFQSQIWITGQDVMTVQTIKNKDIFIIYNNLFSPCE